MYVRPKKVPDKESKPAEATQLRRRWQTEVRCKLRPAVPEDDWSSVPPPDSGRAGLQVGCGTLACPPAQPASQNRHESLCKVPVGRVW